MKRSLLIILIVLQLCNVFGQGEVPVDLYTGTPIIDLPLWTINDHDLSQTVGIHYNASGLRLEQTPERVGLGWSLSGVGRISREVRGLPDDFDGLGSKKRDSVDWDDRRGWITPLGTYGLPAQFVKNFSPGADLSDGTCGDEAADYSALANTFFYLDTEPDIFYFSAPGVSGAFVFDNAPSPQIHLIPFQDVEITYSRSHVTKKIIAFRIQTNRGITYYFDRPVAEQFSTHTLSAEGSRFLRRYLLINNDNVLEIEPPNDSTGNIEFNSEWMLTKITSPSGATLSFSYSKKSDFETMDTLKVGVHKDATGTLKTILAHRTYRKIERQRINTISSSNGQRVELFYKDSLVHRIQIIDDRNVENSLIKEYLFTHRKVLSPPDTLLGRYFLESVQEKAGDQALPPYRFRYTGVNFLNNTTQLPSYHSRAKDFWGYYNGKSNSSLFPKLYVYPALDYPDKVRVTRIPDYSGEEIILPGADRKPDALLMEVGALNAIEYPLGGSLHIDYEPHTYFDSVANMNSMGGGLRIRSFTYFDGVDPSSLIVRDFNYEDESENSSGRLLSAPAFYIPTAKYVFTPDYGSQITKTYTELLSAPTRDLWDHLLVRTEENLAEEAVVRYKKVTTRQLGQGSVTTLFVLPAATEDTSSGYWSATQNKFARYSSCEPMGILNPGGPWRYPFVDNSNLEYERGQILKKSEYNEGGALVRETDNTYQYLYREGSEPFKVWGLDFEEVPNQSAYAFAKYFLLTDVVKVPSTITETIYDETDSLKSITRKVEFLYQSGAHRLLTEKRTTNSNGTVYATKMKYPLDYGQVPETDDTMARMIRELQFLHRTGNPIEVYQTIQQLNEDEKVLSAHLTKFDDFETGVPLVKANYQIDISAPLSDFSPSSIQFVDNEYKFVADERYGMTDEIVRYGDVYKVPISVYNPLSRTVGGTLWGYDGTLPIAQVTYAKPSQIAFSDFETTSVSSFTQSDDVYGTGRTGRNGLHPSVALSKTVVKGTTDHAILSFWIKTNGTPADFNIIVKDTSLATTYLTSSFSANSDIAYHYSLIEQAIDISSFPSMFHIELKGQLGPGPFASAPTLLPLIDDVAFLPKGSELISSTYAIPWGPSAVTDYTGLTTFQEYDRLGRSTVTRDKDGNIKVRRSYVSALDPDVLAEGFEVFSANETSPLGTAYITANQPVRFVAQEELHENVTYEWDFGSGFSIGSREMEKAFTPGTYNVQLRVSKPGYIAQTSNIRTLRTVTSIVVCAEGVKRYDPVADEVLNTFPNCSLITESTPAMSATFRVDNLDILGTVKWKIRDIGSSSWTVLATDQLQSVVQDIDLRNTGFEVICEIWLGKTLVARSNMVQVEFIH